MEEKTKLTIKTIISLLLIAPLIFLGTCIPLAITGNIIFNRSGATFGIYASVILILIIIIYNVYNVRKKYEQNLNNYSNQNNLNPKLDETNLINEKNTSKNNLENK